MKYPPAPLSPFIPAHPAPARQPLGGKGRPFLFINLRIAPTRTPLPSICKPCPIHQLTNCYFVNSFVFLSIRIAPSFFKKPAQNCPHNRAAFDLRPSTSAFFRFFGVTTSYSRAPKRLRQRVQLLPLLRILPRKAQRLRKQHPEQSQHEPDQRGGRNDQQPLR
jgi:hypothetical protein